MKLITITDQLVMATAFYLIKKLRLKSGVIESILTLS